MGSLLLGPQEESLEKRYPIRRMDNEQRQRRVHIQAKYPQIKSTAISRQRARSKHHQKKTVNQASTRHGHGQKEEKRFSIGNREIQLLFIRVLGQDTTN